MPAPATTDDLLVNLRKSGILSAAQLDESFAHAPFGESPAEYLHRLVDAGLVTRYQAEKLAVGKYKGFVLGPYLILDRIGGGGMGHVFLAEHSAMRRNVALKVLSIHSAQDPVARERFLREARVAAGLNHPNVIRVFDLRREDAIIYLVMEYIEGDSLQHVVARHGALPWATAVDYARQIALGLQHAHENGLVHRDIKPGNLLLSPDGTVKIIDLGLVRWDAEDSKLTDRIDKSILGTADYVAPEQAVNSAGVDIRADIYSLGATLYYMLSGRVMFPDGKTAQKLMWQQLKMPTPIRELVPHLPADLAAVLERCLAKNPVDRFATPAEFAAALAPWCQVAPALPDSSWFPKPYRKSSQSRSSALIAREPRSTAKRPGLESTMLPPLSSDTAKSSHLFQSRRLPIAAVATLAESGEETPRSLPRPAPTEAVSPKPTSPVLWMAVGIALTLVIVGIVVLLKAI